VGVRVPSSAQKPLRNEGLFAWYSGRFSLSLKRTAPMTDKKIQPLTFTEFVRLRPAMYIGNLSLQGFTDLLKHVFEEFHEYALTAPVFEIGFYAGNRVVLDLCNLEVENFGSQLRTWNKNDPVYNHTWIKALIALSVDISIAADTFVLTGRQGDYETPSENYPGGNSITIDFTLDPQIFKEFVINYRDIIPFLQQFAYLNPELKMVCTDHSTKELQRNVFHYPKGICTQLDDMIQQGYHPFVRGRIDMEVAKNEYQYRIALCNNVWGPRDLMRTFAGNIEMIYGGSLENGIVQGISSFLKTIAEREGIKISATKKEVQRHFAFIAAVKGKEFVFEGSTRTKLGVKVIQQDVRELVFKHLMAGYESGNEDIRGLVDRFFAFEEIEEETDRQEDQEEDY
jgi:DNA gyrase/topoisomerase IV subunit B